MHPTHRQRFARHGIALLLAIGLLPTVISAEAASGRASAWLVGTFETVIAGAQGKTLVRMQCVSPAGSCVISMHDEQSTQTSSPDQLDPPLAIDAAPVNAGLEHTRQVLRDDPSLYDEKSGDGDTLRALRGLLSSNDTLVNCVDLYAQKAGPYYMAACTRSSDRDAGRSLVFVATTMAGAPSALSKRPFQYFSFIELKRAQN